MNWQAYRAKYPDADADFDARLRTLGITPSEEARAAYYNHSNKFDVDMSSINDFLARKGAGDVDPVALEGVRRAVAAGAAGAPAAGNPATPPDPWSPSVTSQLPSIAGDVAAQALAEQVASRRTGVPRGAGGAGRIPPPPGGGGGGAPSVGESGKPWWNMLNGEPRRPIHEGVMGRFEKSAAAADAAGAPRAAAKLRGIGGKLAMGSRVLGPAAVGLGTLMAVGGAAQEGMDQGGGFGAVNNAGFTGLGSGLGALAGGVIGSILPGPGTAIGATIGSMIGGGLGGGLGRGTTDMAMKAVESGGPLGQMLDPLIDTPQEIAFRQQARQAEMAMKDPMAMMLRNEQLKREADARAAAAKQLYMQLLVS